MTGVGLTLKAGPKSRSVVRKVAPGIYAQGKDGYRFFARVRTKLHSLVFRPPVPLSLTGVKDAYRQWRDTLLVGPPVPVHRGTFAADVETYLSRVGAMPTFKSRAAMLRRWVALLGPDRPRASITAGEIDHWLQAWLSGGYAAQTVRHRRTALIQVWRVLDGKHAPNPAREATPPARPPAEARGMTMERVDAIFQAIRPSACKTFLWVMVTTGLPHKQIRDLEPTDVDFAGKRIHATPRRKGAGAAGGWRPITDAAVDALRAFLALGPKRKVNRSAVYRVFQRGRAKAGAEHCRPYDLRHSFGTWIYETTGDLSTAAHLLGHASLTTAKIYTLGAQGAVARKAVDALQLPAGLGAKVDAAVAYRVTVDVTRKAGKPSRQRDLANKGTGPL
jgi:integrase